MEDTFAAAHARLRGLCADLDQLSLPRTPEDLTDEYESLVRDITTAATAAYRETRADDPGDPAAAPLPWRTADAGATWWTVVDGEGRVIADLSDSPFDTSEDETKAARVVECVNACEGIDDPAAALDEVRAALAAYLREVRPEGCAEPDCVVCRRSRALVDRAHAALARLGPAR